MAIGHCSQTVCNGTNGLGLATDVFVRQNFHNVDSSISVKQARHKYSHFSVTQLV